MTAKEWLMEAWKTDREIDVLLAASEKVWDRCVSITTQLRNTPGSASPDPHKFDAYIVLTDKLNQRIDKLIRLKAERIEAIGKVGNPIYRTLLTERYINQKTWEQIAVDMNYTFRHVCRLHGSALMELQLTINDKLS